jgi:hypothetical protein
MVNHSEFYAKVKKLRQIMTPGKFVAYEMAYKCYQSHSHDTMDAVFAGLNCDGFVLQLWPQEKVTPWYGNNVK